jgi:uncharacterized protein DUF3592
MKLSDHLPQRFKATHRSVLTIATGLAVAVAGAVWALDTYRLEQRGVVVTGTVLAEHRSNPSDRRPTRSTIDVRYPTEGGRSVDKTTGNYRSAEVGKPIQVVYDPKKPSRMQAADYGFDYRKSGFVFAGAFVIVAIGTFRLWPKIRARMAS